MAGTAYEICPEDTRRNGAINSIRKNQIASHQWWGRIECYSFRSVIHLKFDFCRRNNSRHSSRRALVRTVARDIFIGASTVGSWIHATFPELPHRPIEFGSKSVGHGKCADAKSANNAKCDATEIVEMVHVRRTELLCFAARSQQQWPYQVSIILFAHHAINST